MATHEGYSLGVNTDFGQVKEANKAVGALYRELEKVNQKSKELHIPSSLPREINHVNTVTASYIERLQSEGKTYEANQQKVKAYQGAISQLQTRQKELEQAFSRTASSADKNSEKYRAQQVLINKNATEINHFKDSLKAAQSEMDRLRPTGFDKWTSAAKKVDTATDKVKSKLHSAWDSIRGEATVATAGIAAVGAAAYSGAKQAGTIQQRYREINNLAVLGGEKQKEVTKSVMEMQRQGRDMSIKYGKSQEEIAEGYEDLVKRGYTTKQAVGALQTELQASVASGDKFSDVTTVSSQVLDAFGMRANNTKKMLANTKQVVNELAYSADATSTGFNDLGVAMSYVGTAAKSNNISLAETASALGVLSNNGLESDKAGTALRATINGLNNQINKIGSGKSVFDKLGIKKSEMLDAHGNLKGLSHDMGVLYKHIEEHSKGGADRNDFFKSIFGTTGMNGAMIIAKSSKEVEELTKRTEKAGKTGTYVAKLAAKNMGTAQGSANSAKQAMNAFKMTLGNAVLPAINKASNELAKFLLSKDGKKFQKDIGGAVANVANKFVKFVEWSATHKKEIEWIGKGLLAGYVVSKGVKFIAFLGDVKKGLEAIKAVKFVGGLFGKGGMAGKAIQGVESVGGALPKSVTRGGAGFLTGSLQSLKSAGGFKGLTTAGKVTTGLAGAGIAVDAGSQLFSAFKNRHNADKRSTAIGKGIGAGIGGGIGMFFGGPPGAAVGSQIGKVVGGWGGQAVNHFTKGWQKNKPPKNFWSLENLGWSTKDTFNKIGKGFGTALKNSKKFVEKNGKELALTAVAPWAGIPTLLYKNNPKIKKWANGVGKDIHRGWNHGIKASHKFFKNIPSNMSKMGQNMQKGWNTTWRKINNNRYVHAFQKGKLVQTGIKDMQSRLGAFGTWFGKKWDGMWKGVNNNRYVKAFKRGDLMQTFVKDTQSRWNAFSKDFGKKWNDFWGGLHKGWDGFWGKAGDIRKGITNNVKAFGNDVSYAFGGSKHTFKYEKIKGHAAGGYIASGHTALVGEAGPELAYKNGRNARLLGANGPAITRVHSGEHILNARDTAKVMGGGLGKGYTLKGYASGTDKLEKTSKKVTEDYKQIASKSSKSLTKLSAKSKQTWQGISKHTAKQTDKTKNDAISDYAGMRKGVIKENKKLHDGVIDLAGTTSKGFGKELGRMKGYAHDAMGDTIDQVNKGISGIDKVLGQFGGNTSVIKPVKFAKGTDENGRLTRNTYAMINDATTGPRQEALVSPDNKVYLPKGDNLQLMLPAGWGVLNGTQTKQVTEKTSPQRFAKGSGISHSLLKKIAGKGQQNPAQSFANMFTKNVHSSGTDLRKGSTDLANNSGTKLGVPWMTAMWSVINNAIGGADGKGGTREAFLHYAESTFQGVKYVMGAASKVASDCSGMVMQALRHFGINIGRSTVDMQHSSGTQYLGKNLSNTLPGDLVIFGHGTGAAGHVGIIKNPKTGTMFNETRPYARVTDIASDKSMGYGYYRVKGLHNAAKTKKATASKGLESLAKRELGPSALKWIKDNLGDEGSLGGNIGGEGVQRWAGTVKRILGMLHLSTSKSMVDRVLRQINTESSGNPHARQPGADPDGDGSGPALGLMQTKRGTYEAYKRKGDTGGIFNGPSNIYASLNYAKHRYGNSLSALGNGHGYAKGGRPAVHTPFLAGERGPELITADGPVKVDTHDQTKRKLRDITDIVGRPTPRRTRGSGGKAPIININFNGPIYGGKDAAKQIADIVKREIAKFVVNMGDEFGTDPSFY